MDTLRWIAATTAGFVLGGLALHSPGASGVGSSYLDADLSAAIFGAILGTIVGLTTGTLQLIALRSRNARLVAAAIIAVATAHALADGAPAVWGVPLVAALSGALAALPFAWATGVIDPRAVGTWTFVWAGGWLAGVTVAGALGLTGGEHRRSGGTSTP